MDSKQRNALIKQLLKNIDEANFNALTAEPVKLVYVKPVAHDATGLVNTNYLRRYNMSVNLETLRDDVYQDEEAQAARDAAKEQG